MVPGPAGFMMKTHYPFIYRRCGTHASPNGPNLYHL